MKYLIFLGSIFLVCTSILYAQGSGKITGTITDGSTGEALIGATIMIEGTRYGAASDFEGQYIIINVPSGVYTIAASILGYNKTVVKNVLVSTDLTTNVDFKLSQSVILNDEVVIIAEAPMIKKDLTATEARMSSAEIANLPLQNLTQLISQQAGVSKDAGGGIHIRGGRSTEISYLVNGISITDDYSRSQALEIETESIQELQVISGTFNAEYGNSMSGVVNIVTKTGGEKFHGGIEAWSGDYLSTHKDIFWGIENISPAANYNLQGTFSGPIYSDKATFFLTARRTNNDGYIYGINAYSPQGRSMQVDSIFVPVNGDSSFVSMNSNKRLSGQASFDWQISGDLKIKIDALGSNEKVRFYDALYRLNPNGINTTTNNGVSVIAKITNQLWENTFHEITVAYKFNESFSRLYDSPSDPRYTHPDSLNIQGYHFRTAGTNLNRFERNTKSIIGKWDLTSQADKHNLAKIGVEVQTDKVFYENINLIAAKNSSGQDIVPFQPMIQGIETTNHDKFERTPFKVAAYIQDKIELQNMIINIGLRIEAFDPRGRIPVDREDPNIYNPFKLEHIYKDVDSDGKIGLDEQVDANKYTLQEREKFWYKSTTIKRQISPRFGIAYPITDKGIIRFSYGIFQQIPEYSQLYFGDQFKLTSAQGTQGPFGNNDLKPQRTTIYEIGLQQQFFDDFAVDVTAFYRDIRDWISSSQPIPTFLAGISYSERVNRDFANVRGITLSLKKRYSNSFSFQIDYTYQNAEGTNSNPDEEFFSQRDNSEPKRQLAPLSWDQTHTLNANIYVGDENWGTSLIGNLNSGQPYTPTLLQGTNTGKDIKSGLVANSLQKPMNIKFDLEVFRNFSLMDINLQLFVKVFNLLDAKNPINVYGDTGKPDFSVDQLRVTDYDKGWFVNPSFYGEPRSFYLGTKISL